MSPFDIVKSLVSSKEYLYDQASVMDKEYQPFMVNRILSNSPQTVLFADVINQYSGLGKKLQYDFYFYGIGRQRSNSKWIKKEEKDISAEYLAYISEQMNVGLTRAIEIYNILGSDVIKVEMALRGGKSAVK